MSPNRLIRRTAFRLAAVYAVLFTITMISIFGVLYFSISRDLTNNLKRQVDELRDTLVAVGVTGGRSALAAAVAKSAKSAQQEEKILVLTDTDGNFIAGNILPVHRFSTWGSIDWSSLPFVSVWSQPVNSSAVVGLWTKVADGYLFVAAGNGDVNEVQDILLDGLGWAVLLTGISAVLGGYALGAGAQRRVDAIESALDSFAHGNLSDRVYRHKSRDDLDRVAELINGTLDRLQKLIGSVKQVSTDIAHDLKTPISRIRQRLEVAQSATLGGSEYKNVIEAALSEIDQVVDSFEALLRIAEVEAGARKAAFAAVNLQTLLANVVEALEPVAEDQGQRLTADFAHAASATVRGDRQLLNQLFVNVIENSIRHCPLGSSISVTVQPDGEEVVVHVADDGPGIPELEQENVFRPLYRLEMNRTTPGSGLGLSLVAAIADLHEGTIKLRDNDPGLDVCVRFRRMGTW